MTKPIMVMVMGPIIMHYFNELLGVLDTSTIKELKKTNDGIFKQMAWAAGGTALGWCVGGPPGALIGGIVGISKKMRWTGIGILIGACVCGPIGAAIGGFVAFACCYMTSDDYKSVVTVVKNLTDEEKRRLVFKVQKLVGSQEVEALKWFIKRKENCESLINCVQQCVNKKDGK